MNLKLPVEVSLSVSPSGSFALVIGGLDVPVSPVELSTVMRAGPERPPEGVPKAFPSGKRMGRPPMPMCRYGDAKAMPGKKLCQKHHATAAKSVAKARAAKRASKKAA